MEVIVTPTGEDQQQEQHTNISTHRTICIATTLHVPGQLGNNNEHARVHENVVTECVHECAVFGKGSDQWL